MTFEKWLKENLGVGTLKKIIGSGGGGCINQGEGYHSDKFGKIFVKMNSKKEALCMFNGEFSSLQAIYETKTIRVPKPIKVLDNSPNGGAVLVMEYMEMKSTSKFSAKLGEDLAKLHLHNSTLNESDPKHVKRFGFHVKTCCGILPQGNQWHDDWVKFYTNKLEEQIKMLQDERRDTSANDLWVEIQKVIPSLFTGIKIVPSLLHGDLWGGNAAETNDGPVIFDPASFYGHHEYELAIAGMFGGFDRTFYQAYHGLIPKQEGFEARQNLYQLFHYLNHWNHFGGGYKSQSISIMKSLIKS